MTNPPTTHRSGKAARQAAAERHRVAQATEAAETAQLDKLVADMAKAFVRNSGSLWAEANGERRVAALGAALELLGATIPVLAERGWTKWPARAMARRPEWNKGHWTPEQLLTPELIEAVARQPFDKPTTAQWESVDMLTRIVLTQIVRDMLTPVFPLILDAGYSPPTQQHP